MLTKVNSEARERVRDRIVDAYAENLTELIRQKANAAAKSSVDMEDVEDAVREFLADFAAELEVIAR